MLIRKFRELRILKVEKNKHYLEIKRYIVSRVRNPHDAEDITQRIFLEYFRNNDEDINVHEIKLKLFGISKNLLAKYYQEIQKQPKLIPLDILEEECSIIKDKQSTELLKTQKLKNILRKSLKKLSLKNYKTIQLFLNNHCSLKESALKAGIPYYTFCKRYQRAIKNLQEIILKFSEHDFDS